MADRYDYHRPATIAAFLAMAAASLAAIGAHSLVLCLAAAACGAGASFGMIAMQRTASRMARNTVERLRIFSWIAMAPAIAGFVGPLTAGMLIDRAGFPGCLRRARRARRAADRHLVADAADRSASLRRLQRP